VKGYVYAYTRCKNKTHATVTLSTAFRLFTTIQQMATLQLPTKTTNPNPNPNPIPNPNTLILP